MTRVGYPNLLPLAPATQVRRRIVDELLDDATRRRVCVLIGAAGWGKTTAVSSWTTKTAMAWVRCSGPEEAADAFLLDVYGALQAHVVTFLTADGPPEVEAGGAALCAHLHAHLHEDVILVIDDVQELRAGGGAARLLEDLCRHVPERLHLVLVSRQEPPFSLERLRGQGLVAEIAAPDLALDVVDVAALLHRTVGEVSAGLPARVWERTGGWPAAVTAAVELLRGVEPDQRLGLLEHLSRPGERLHGYLTEEVIDSEPAPVRELLRRLAVFGEARSTTGVGAGIDDATALLADLARRGLVRRDAGDSVRWSLVQPLRDYFAHEAVLPSGDRATLHLAAAQDCLAREAPGEALRHLAAAGDHARCAAMLLDHGVALLNSGQIDAVLDAAELPEQYLGDPRIQQVLGQARQVRGEWAAAMECFERAGDDPAELEPALAWRMAQIAFMQGEFPEVRAVYDRTRFTGQDTADETQMLGLVATTLRMVGDLMGLQEVQTRAVAAARRCGAPRAWAAVHNVLALRAGADADRSQADVHFANALDSAAAGDDLLQASSIQASHAFHLLELGLPRPALAEAQTALRLSERCQNLFRTAQALTTRGRANVRLGVLDPALADFVTAIDLFQRMGTRFVAWPLCGLGDVYSARGQLGRARAVYEEALALVEPHHDVFGLSSALIGLARVRAADDLTVARTLADRAVALHETLREVPALLTRGWVALLAEDRAAARIDAAQAAAAARLRRDGPGLAEAMILTVLASDQPVAGVTLFSEAIDIWRESGCRLDEAAARVVAARIGTDLPELGADLAEQTLRDSGVDVGSHRMSAGPLAVMSSYAPSVSIRALGAFQVLCDGVPVPKAAWQSKKARDLLKLLVTRRRPVPREQLIELLWPEVDPARAGNRLSVLLSMVRDVLQPQRPDAGPLVTDGHAVWLDLRQVDVDVENFLGHAEGALEAHRRGVPGVIGRLVEAEAAHTGGFLEDDPYQDWAEPLAEEVRAAYIAVLRAVTVRLREAGDVDGVVRYMLRLLNMDGYDEQVHLDLVAVLLEAGRLGEARRRYQIYVRQMGDIGVAPGRMPRVTRAAGRT
ncbi:MAG: BTAD domain-containing putative transcriptional regulator [Pseudonocardia sp.]